MRYVEGTSAGQVDELVGAVRLINASLPRDFQLTVDSTPVTAAADAAGTSSETLAAGQILVEFDRREDWEISYDPAANPVGAALWWGRGGAAITARVYVDDTRVYAPQRQGTLVHELIHALGRDHPDRARFPDSIMNIPSMAADAYVLYPLDREALLAVYGTLSPGATPGEIATDLGPWDDESIHLRGDLGDLAFGASLRNGLAQPWAAVPRPGIDLADNDALTGSATWTGRLLGLTPTADSVAAAAGLTIDLASLRGTLDFTEPGILGRRARPRRQRRHLARRRPQLHHQRARQPVRAHRRRRGPHHRRLLGRLPRGHGRHTHPRRPPRRLRRHALTERRKSTTMFDQLDDQRRFAALAEMGDIAAAAERLGITRNALSKTLARLEECCGIPLFERFPEGRVSLTPLGGEVLEDVRQILQRTEVLQEKISAARSAATQDEAAGVKFSLRISASDNDRLDALLALLAKTQVDGFGLKVSKNGWFVRTMREGMDRDEAALRALCKGEAAEKT